MIEVAIDDRLLRRDDLAGIVALRARNCGVLAIEDEACLTMIKCLLRRLPSYQGKVGSVMFGVAANTTVILRIRSDVGRVQSAMFLKLLRYFAMTFQTFEIR